MLEFKGYAATELAAIKLKSTKTTRELFCNEIYIKPIGVPKKAFSLTFCGFAMAAKGRT